MAIDARQINYTIKISNDPTNVAAAQQTAAVAGRTLEQIKLSTAAMREQTAGYQASAAASRAATAATSSRIKEMQAETAQIRAQIAQEKALTAARKATAVASNAGTFASGILSAHAQSGLSESTRINDRGNFRLNLFSHLQGIVDIAIAAIIGNAVLQIADDFTKLASKIRINTQTEQEAIAVRQRLVQTATVTHSSLAETVDLWEKLTVAGGRYHKTEKDIINIQEGLYKALRVGGASNEQAHASMERLVEVMNRGRISGQGLTEIFRTAPEFMNLLATAMNKPINYFSQMRTSTKDAQKAAQEFFNGIQKLASDPDLQQKFLKIPVTMNEGWQDAKTGFEVMVGTINEKMKATDGIGSFFEKLGLMFRDPKVISGVTAFANIIGGLLIGVLKQLGNVLDFVRAHTELVTNIMTVLGYWLEIRLVTSLIKVGTGFGTATTLAAKFGSIVYSVSKAILGMSLFKEADTVKTALNTAAVAANTKALETNAAVRGGVGRLGLGTVGQSAGSVGRLGLGIASGDVAAEGETMAAAGGAALVPWLAIPAAIAAAVAAVYIFGDAIDASGKQAFTLKDIFRGTWLYIADAAATSAQYVADRWNEPWPSITSQADGWAQGMNSLFQWVVDKAKEAAPQVGNAFIAALSAIPVVGDATKLAVGLAGAAAAAGQRGADARQGVNVPGARRVKPGWIPTDSEIALNNALNQKLRPQPPVGNLGGNKSHDKQDPVQEAIASLNDYIRTTNEATKATLAMADAQLRGPSAVRQAQADEAANKERLQATEALQKAEARRQKLKDDDYSKIKLNEKELAIVEKAASAAREAELAKQKEAYDSFLYSIDASTKALQNQADIIQIGLRPWTADINLRRQWEREVAVQTTYQEDLNKAIADGYEITDEITSRARKHAEAQGHLFDLQQTQKDLSTIGSLIEQYMTPDEQAMLKWNELQAAVDDIRNTSEWAAMGDAAQKALLRAKPPTNLWEALHRGMQDFTDEFRMGWGQVADGIKGTISDLANNFIQMVQEGKISFKSLALSVIKDLEAMILKALIFKAVMGIMNAIFPGSGTIVGAGGGLLTNAVGGSVATLGGAPIAHSGGIAGMLSGSMRSVHPGAFAMAQRYHTGGLAGMMGLMSGEVPIIAKKGEAILPTVRMPDGSFGVRAAGGGGSVFAPNINVTVDAKGRGAGPGGEMTPEQQKKLSQLLDDEINTHLQRKMEEWLRPGGQLYMAQRR